MQSHKKRKLYKFMVYSLLIIFAFLMVSPVYILVKVSISEPEEVNTDHPTFLVHDATLDHWKSILTSEKKTEKGQIIYHLDEDYLIQGRDGDTLQLTTKDEYTINGVMKRVTLLDSGQSIIVDQAELNKLRDVSQVTLDFFNKDTYNKLYGPLLKSLKVASLTTIIAIIIAAPAAYVISRMPRKWKYIVILSLLFTRMFPDVGIALPIATRFHSWGLIDNTLGLVLAHLIPNLPFLAWILVGTFEVIPVDLEKAAMIDGANRLTALRKIIFPIAAPGIAVGAMFVWLASWNEFIYARYLSTVASTLPIKTYEVITTGTLFSAAAYATMLTIPVIIITFFLQRYLQSGMLSGAVK